MTRTMTLTLMAVIPLTTRLETALAGAAETYSAADGFGAKAVGASAKGSS